LQDVSGWLRRARTERIVEEPGRPISAKHPSLRFLRETITVGIADMGVGKAHSSGEVRET
jgi:hypothetical protein